MRVLIALVFMLAMTSPVSAQITFEESGPVPTECQWGGNLTDYTEFAGYTWSGFRPLSLTNYNVTCNPRHGSGYTGIPTTNNEYVAIGFGVSTITAPGPIRLLGFNAGAGWNRTSLDIDYFLNGQWNNLAILDLSVGGYQQFAFDQTIEALRFTPTWVESGGFGTDYNTFYIDNVEFVPDPITVPEPSSWALMTVGFGALVAGRRRKQKI